MEKVYYEYFLDNENYITGWQSWPQAKRPDLRNNPEPLKQMNDTVNDENGQLWNVDTNRNFQLIGNEIEVIQHEKTDDEKFDSKYSIKEAFRRIVKGMRNGLLDPNFLEFADDIEKTIRKK